MSVDFSLNQTMILAAGFGKRLQPFTLTVPKPLIPLHNRPLLDYTFDHLRHAGITRCIVNTHYLSEQIETYLSTQHDMEIATSYEPILLETGGGLNKALPFFKDTPFFSMNGDIWWQDQGESALSKLRAAWDSSKMDILLLLIPKEKAIGFSGPGDYFLEPTGRLTYRADLSAPPYIYGGIQILSPSLFEGCPSGPFPIPDLYHQAEKAGRLYGVVHTGLWCDIGSLSALKALKDVLAK